jgi:hypothetical protein
MKMKRDFNDINNNLKKDKRKEDRKLIIQNIQTNNVGLAINMVT